MSSTIPSRAELIKKQKEEVFDLVVIGGGATGAGVARDAALRGLSVALVEKGDFSSGTSSQSTKLLHGGLRYLKNFEFGLVREAALERMTNLRIGPHLGTIRDFIVPMYRWSEDRPIMLRMGLWVYDALSFPKNLGRHRWLNSQELVEHEPLLAHEDLKGGGLYQDVYTHDSRLVMANLLSAIQHGAAATNYTEAVDWTFTETGVIIEILDTETDQSYKISGRTLINCTGAWTERVEDLMDGFEGKAELRPTWGAHLMLKKKSSGYPILIVNRDGRAVFLISMGDYDMAGTTDIDYKGDPDKIAPTEFDQEYILDAVNQMFPTAKYSKEDVVSAFSGLRPLVSMKGVAEGKISRNHEIFVDRDNRVITVVGGKLTTYRVMAKEAVDDALKLLGLSKRHHKCTTDKVPLFGGDVDYGDWDDYLATKAVELRSRFDLDEKCARTMVTYYGTQVDNLAEIIEEHGAQKFKDERPWLEAQVIYACRYELVRNPVDFLRRRTWMMLEEENGVDVLDRVVALMTDEMGWDQETAEQMTAYSMDYINSYIKIQPTEDIIPKEQAEKLKVPTAD